MIACTVTHNELRPDATSSTHQAILHKVTRSINRIHATDDERRERISSVWLLPLVSKQHNSQMVADLWFSGFILYSALELSVREIRVTVL